jgi:hypothetical protein
MNLQEAIGIALASLCSLIGMRTLKDPLWFHQLAYRWLALIRQDQLPSERRQDMQLLFEDPVDWQTRHRSAVFWTRLHLGWGALLLGLVAMAVIVVAAAI